jgi:hypothetical protein
MVGHICHRFTFVRYDSISFPRLANQQIGNKSENLRHISRILRENGVALLENEPRLRSFCVCDFLALRPRRAVDRKKPQRMVIDGYFDFDTEWKWNLSRAKIK